MISMTSDKIATGRRGTDAVAGQYDDSERLRAHLERRELVGIRAGRAIAVACQVPTDEKAERQAEIRSYKKDHCRADLIIQQHLCLYA